MKPKARHNSPRNLKIKRIMASCALREYASPAYRILCPAIWFNSRLEARRHCGWGKGRSWRIALMLSRVGGRAVDARLILGQRAFDPLPVILLGTARG